MKIIDEMLNLDLLTHEQHLQISAWIARSTSPEEILQMPAPLWQAVERASQTMGINEDLLRPPSLDAGVWCWASCKRMPTGASLTAEEPVFESRPP